ncbi:MAG TPA: adenylate/guanylate cyclase domain-containing protein [Acidimicrobiales bacterium]|nr:adenylate/guanylate cyclase domain-containing protein [Acidimicrobiales bacterium]
MAAPSGTVTFLFTDIEGSTRLWETAPEAMRSALERHDEILGQAIGRHGGYVFSTGGDGFGAAFSRASDAVAAARAAQTQLGGEPWPEGAHISVRMGLDTGEAAERDGDYFGPALNRSARITAVAHGGQLLCSEVTAGLVRDRVPLVDLDRHRLRDLSAPQRIFQVGPGEFPALRSVDAFPGNLPLQLSSFVGRSNELERVAAALETSRVVTLTGVGGVGKTRLALQVAAEVLPRFRDGAWLCELAPIRDPTSLADTLASIFDLVPRGGQPPEEALGAFLRSKELLLVLDNCEHLLTATAGLVERLERSCSRLSVLATSREGLGIDGERILVVPSLAAPDSEADLEAVAQADSVRLFVERAQAVKSEFTLTQENAASLGHLCRRLDGIPLAIELAAARVPVMNPAELARRLDRRFEVLAGGRRGAVERHQTLRAAIDWSYELATVAQRRLLARLTVFAGGCTLEAVEAICGDDLVEPTAVWELMAQLVAQSLVVAEDQGQETRYRLLETIRQYGEERLTEHGGGAELRRRHAEYYAQLAVSLAQSFLGPDQVASGARLAAEQENLLRALTWAVDTKDVDLAFQLVCAVPPIDIQSGFGFQLPPEAALSLPGAEEHPRYPLALAVAARMAAFHGENERVEQLCEQALAAAVRLGPDPDGRVDAEVGLTRVLLAVNRGRWHDAAVQGQANSELNRRNGRTSGAAINLIGAGHCHAMAGDPDLGLPLATEGLALARQTGMPHLIGMGLNALASALASRDPDKARDLLREGLQFAKTVGHESTTEFTVATLVAAELRDRQLVLDLASRAVPMLHWNGDRPQLAGVLNLVAWAVADVEPEEAAVLQGAARRLTLEAFEQAAPRRDLPAAPDGVTSVITDIRRETSRHLTAVLGHEGVRLRREQGGGLDADQAVGVAVGVMKRVRPA